MKKIFWTIILAIAFAGSSALGADEICPGIAAGEKAYSENNFDDAIRQWRSCTDRGMENADLLYNLGNAYFRNGKLGFAIYYYKSAQELRTNEADIRHNLNYASAMTKDKVGEEDEENPLLAGLFKAHHALSLKAQLYILLGLVWAFTLLALSRRLGTSAKLKNISVGISFIIVFAFCILGASAGYKIFMAETDITGVVTAADTDVTSAPSEKSQTLNTLSEGTSFDIISQQGDFLEIKLGERIKGFVPKKDVGIVK